jgi:uncharacterized membrane protein
MTHLADMAWFALIVSVVLAMLSRRKLIDRVKYTIGSFVLFILIAVAMGWLMYPFSR